MKVMSVQCGTFHWKGRARSANDAIKRAMGKIIPPNFISPLLRIHNGGAWFYIDFKSALRIAGYHVIDIDSLEGGGFVVAAKRKRRVK